MPEEELLLLHENSFNQASVLSWEDLPAHDEAFVPVWEKYLRETETTGCFTLLQERSIQIAEPAVLRLELYQTWAGRIPVIQTSNRTDFVTLVQVLVHKNEPVTIPPSMGACLVKGFTIRGLFKNYNCRFLILTDIEYSNVPAELLGLTTEEWRRLSYLIRREHEATHYFTLRFLGSAKNHLFDEFIADYMGIVAAIGRYRADWFLCFLGLENPQAFRQGGRLLNYLKNLDISGIAFAQLKQYLIMAAGNLEGFSNKYSARIYTPEGRYRMLLTMSRLNLALLASDSCERLLLENGLGDYCTKEG